MTPTSQTRHQTGELAAAPDDEAASAAQGSGVPGWETQIDAIRAGDEAALGQMLEETRSYLLLVADRELDGQLRAKVGASDIVQDTLLEAGQGIGAFRGGTEDELRAWLLRILRHNLTDVARKYFVATRRAVGRELPLLEGLEPATRPGNSPSSIVRRAEADEELDAAIDQLPEKYRSAVLLRHQQRLSWNEVGQQLGITAEAARKIWSRAIRQLRDALQGNDVRRRSTSGPDSPR
jgi:RNA polymerase sigma-70 factor (ECF subfamily)